MTNEVIVTFSGGKDSLATLDLCTRQFERVEAVFMYWVRGLEFQQRIIRWTEDRYGIKIHQVPHFEIASLMGSQVLSYYRPSYPAYRATSARELDDHIRRHFGIEWIASGEKMVDSIERRAMMSASGQWDKARMHYYPLMHWTTKQVVNYNRFRNIILPAEYAFLRRSWAGFIGEDLVEIRKHYPDDYRKILEVFPFAEAITRRYELYSDHTPNKRTAAVSSR